MKPVLNAFGMISHWIPNEPIEIKKDTEVAEKVVKPAKKVVKPAKKGVK